MPPLICIDSAPSLINPHQLIEGKKYYPYFFMPGFKRGKLLVMLKGVEGSWDYDRFLPASVELEIENEIQNALK